VVDFTSALYLGLTHASHSLRPWAQLTTGAPAALKPPPGSGQVASRLAALMGCESAVLAPSTLHLFWDLLGLWAAREPLAIYLDAGAYPMARWGVERAQALGARVHIFPHYDAGALKRLLARTGRAGRHPLIVADGACLDSGQPAPVPAFLHCLETSGGHLVLDDTQALGIFGERPETHGPYGAGGGGTLRWHGLKSPQIILITSLAKGFGVPMACLSGSRSVIGAFKAVSDTRVYCSPPSAAALEAARQALEVNREQGEARRRRLAHLVRHFRRRLLEMGLAAGGGLFPVQTLTADPRLDPVSLYARLRQQGISTVLRQGKIQQPPLLTFVLTARHRRADLDRAVAALARAAEASHNPNFGYGG
jgi:8-amino-7-oxononanoate synthase